MTRVKPVGAISTSLLDIVRFLCSQGVLAGHLFYFTGLHAGILEGLASYCLIIFFILSGMLISGSLLQKIQSQQQYGFREFFADRFFRIYPPFVASLVFVFALDIVGYFLTNQPFSITQYIFNFFLNLLQLQEFPVATYLNEKYMIEFFRFHYFGTNLPLWTIGIEWWMYMAFGLLTFLLTKRLKFRIHHLLILCFFMITPVYFMIKSGRMERGLTLYWVLGVIITLLAGNHRTHKFNTPYLLAGLACTATGLAGFIFFTFPLAALIFSIGILLVLTGDDQNGWKPGSVISNAAEFLAGYSYSLYLIHYPIIYFGIHVFKPESKISTFITLYVIVNIIAIIFARLFEKPSKHWKKVYENYRSRNH